MKIHSCMLPFVGLLAIATVQLSYANESDYQYSVQNGQAEISRYTGSGGDIAIPSELGGFPVAAIGNWAFESDYNITGVTMPASIKSIGDYAFFNCPVLQDVTISEGTVSIGIYAFSFCNSISTIIIPASVVSIGDSAFNACGSLTAINVRPENLNYRSVYGVLLNRSMSLLITCPGNKIGSFTIPDSVIVIAPNAFSDCSQITNVSGGDNLTVIGSAAFIGCASLESITLPDSLEQIGEYAFGYCTSLADIVIPDSIREINPSVFTGCSALQTVRLPSALEYIGSSAFADCQSLIEAVIPDGVTQIEAQAFSGCTSLSFVQLPGDLVTIESYTFAHCISLDSIVIPDSVTYINDNAFLSCTALRSVSLGKSVNSFGSFYLAFYGCNNIEEISLHFNLASFSLVNIFPQSYWRIKKITVGAEVSSIGNYAFASSSSLKWIYFQGDAPTHGNGVFSGSSSVQSLYLPDKTGWTETYGGRPALLWNPLIVPDNASAETAPAFLVTGTPGIPVALETTTNLLTTGWIRIVSGTITEEGYLSLPDPDDGTAISRFFRIVAP